MDEKLLVWIIAAILGALGSPSLIDWLKHKFNLEGTTALFLASAVSVVIAVAWLFAAGKVGLADFTWANLPAVASTVFAFASFVYKLLNPEPQS